MRVRQEGNPDGAAAHSPGSHFPSSAATAGTQSEPGSERERESEAGAGRKGRRVPGAGGSSKPPGPAVPKAGRAKSRARRGANKARSVRDPHARAATATGGDLAGTERPLFPRTKGTAAPGGCPSHGGAAPATATSAGMPGGAGMREVPQGMRGWSAASQGSGEKEKMRGRDNRTNLRGFSLLFKFEFRDGGATAVTATQSRCHPEPLPRVTRRGN